LTSGAFLSESSIVFEVKQANFDLSGQCGSRQTRKNNSLTVLIQINAIVRWQK
jgi:hypothetical protein